MKLKFSYLLIFLAALAQGVMWINVFRVLGLSDGLAIAGGICAGTATVGMSTRAANFLPGVQSKRARQWGWPILIVFILAEMIVLGNSNYMTMPVESYITAYGASLVVTLALIAGAMVDRSLIPAEKQTQPKTKPKKAHEIAKEITTPAFRCATCGFEAKSQKALNGHKRKHSKVTGYKVSFEPIKKDETK